MFGDRTTKTSLLWTSYFFTLLAVYFLLNWLPTLMAAKNGNISAGPMAAIVLNIGAIVGSLALDRLSDSRSVSGVVPLTYAGMVGSLLLLVFSDHQLAAVACFAVGFFVIGGQLVLYALAPTVYARRVSTNRPAASRTSPQVVPGR